MGKIYELFHSCVFPRVSTSDLQRVPCDFASCHSHSAEDQSLCDGAVQVFPAVPLCWSKKIFQKGSHEVKSDSSFTCFCLLKIILHAFAKK